MSFDRFQYEVGDLPQAPQLLTVDASGRAVYESYTNPSILDRPVIGVYEMTLPKTTRDELGGLLAQPLFEWVPDHWGRVMSGDRTRRVRVFRQGRETQKFVGTREPVDPTLARILDKLDQIVLEVLDHPKSTLHMDVSRIARRGAAQLSIELSFTNTGTAPANLRHPGDLANAPDGELALDIWAEEQPADASAVRMILTEVHEKQLPPSSREDRTVIELAPGQAASFHVVAEHAPTGSGTHRAKLTYTSLLREWQGRPLMVGEIFSKPVNVEALAGDPGAQ